MRNDLAKLLMPVFCCFTLLFLSVSINAQKANTHASAERAVLPTVRTLTKGKLHLSLGKTQRTIDLSKDISGCLTIYDATMPKARPSDATHFQVVDKIWQNKMFYFVLLASAQGGCNVNGQCGAASDATIIWLKLDQNLRVAEKQAVPVDSCLTGISLISPEQFGFSAESGKFIPLRLDKNILRIEYEQNRYDETNQYKVSQLIYNHETPEKGLLVTAENKERPKSN